MKRLFLIILISISAVSCERDDVYTNVESGLGLLLSLFNQNSSPVFVAAGINGSGGSIWYSSNPDAGPGSWTEVAIGVSLPAYGVAYGKGLYVVVGGTSGNDNGFIYTSSDLKTWTARNTGNAALQTVCYRSDIGVFCAAGYGTADRVCWSADGINWYDAINTGTNNIWLVSGGSGYFTVMGPAPTCIYSGTGATGTWNNSPQPILDIPYCLTYGNGIFVCGSTRAGGGVYRSFNGYDWIPINGTPVGMGGIAGGGGVFCGIHSSNTAYFSMDNGATWPVSTSYSPTLWAVAYGGGRFVAGGTNITVFGVVGNLITSYSIGSGNIYSITYKP